MLWNWGGVLLLPLPPTFKFAPQNMMHHESRLPHPPSLNDQETLLQ